MRGQHLAYAMAATAGATLAAGLAFYAVTAQTQNAGPQTLPPARIDWQGVARDYNPGVEAKAEANRGLRARQSDLDNTNIPILLPADGSGFSTQGLIFYSLGDAYDVNIAQPVPGLTVLLSGNRVYVPVEAGTLSRTKYDRVDIGGSDAEVLIERTEDGWLASFARYGVSYTAEITCGSPEAMATCDKPAAVVQLVRSLTTVVLGAKAQRVFIAANPNGAPPPTIKPGSLKAATFNDQVVR